MGQKSITYNVKSEEGLLPNSVLLGSEGRAISRTRWEYFALGDQNLAPTVELNLEVGLEG